MTQVKTFPRNHLIPNNGHPTTILKNFQLTRGFQPDNLNIGKIILFLIQIGAEILHLNEVNTVFLHGKTLI